MQATGELAAKKAFLAGFERVEHGDGLGWNILKTG
jgi:hypothetical protein